jgi:putative intracellular protease/amidase
MTKTNSVLIIVTNTDEYEKVGYRTGLWLGELTHFWDVLEAADYQMDIASPLGGKIPIDPISLLRTELEDAVGLRAAVSKRYEDRAFMNRLQTTLKIADVDVTAYDAIYMTGGHGVMFDFPHSSALAALTTQFYESNKIVSAVCHGPCGLLEAKQRNGDYLIKGKNVTGFSWKEEILAKRDQAVPFSLEEELQKRGAIYSKARLPFVPHVVENGLLITGQNPTSPKAVAEAVVKKLRAMT